MNQHHNAEFHELIDGLRLRHFTPDEFLVKIDATRNGVKNTPPPKVLWPKILKTAILVDEIRHRVGAPIELLSGYRSTAYNKAVGGEPNSFHKQFMALDFTSDQVKAKALHKIAASLRGHLFRTPPSTTLAAFKWDGGLGLYVQSNFVHVDCRLARADWKGN